MNDLHLAWHGGETIGCGYKYTATRGAASFTAFATDQEFIGWLALMKIEIRLNYERMEPDQCGQTRCTFRSWFANKQIKDGFFWQLEDLPDGCKPFIGLSNGSYVTCYLQIGETVNTIYRPNPNARATVYKPFDYKEAKALVHCGCFDVTELRMEAA
jgi:hypothetical protein